MTTPLPERPSLTSLKYQAKQLLKRHRNEDATLCALLRSLPKWNGRSDAEILGGKFVLADAQHAVAQSYGFSDWLALRDHVLASGEHPDRGPLTEDLRQEFKHRGIVRLPKLLSADVAAQVRETVHHVFERADMWRGGRWVGDRLTGDDYFIKVHSPLLKKLKAVTKSCAAISDLCTPDLHNAAEFMVDGRKLVTYLERPQLLFTAPNADRWDVPHKMWHMDVPRLGEIGCPGVQMFTFVDRVDRESGGTLVAAGSHHYINNQGRVRSKHVKRQLSREYTWFKELFRPNGDRTAHFESITKDGEIELQVLELTGEPGDVWLMDLRMLHSLAPNTSNRPRLMMTQRYFLSELGDSAYVDT